MTLDNVRCLLNALHKFNSRGWKLGSGSLSSKALVSLHLQRSQTWDSKCQEPQHGKERWEGLLPFSSASEAAQLRATSYPAPQGPESRLVGNVPPTLPRRVLLTLLQVFPENCPFPPWWLCPPAPFSLQVGAEAHGQCLCPVTSRCWLPDFCLPGANGFLGCLCSTELWPLSHNQTTPRLT